MSTPIWHIRLVQERSSLNAVNLDPLRELLPGDQKLAVGLDMTEVLGDPGINSNMRTSVCGIGRWG